jgi:hypothetical protein
MEILSHLPCIGRCIVFSSGVARCGHRGWKSKISWTKKTRLAAKSLTNRVRPRRGRASKHGTFDGSPSQRNELQWKTGWHTSYQVRRSRHLVPRSPRFFPSASVVTYPKTKNVAKMFYVFKFKWGCFCLMFVFSKLFPIFQIIPNLQSYTRFPKLNPIF